MHDAILELRSFTKFFRSHWTFRSSCAVQDVSFKVGHGEAFGFLGHNGAGKTTTIKAIVGLIKTTSGEILLDGQPLRQSQQRSLLGYLPEQQYFYDHLTVEETLDFFACLHGLSGSDKRKRVAELLERVELLDRRNHAIGTLSKGLRQRLGLAQAIINRPKLLLLDEPFSGLDPLGRYKFREILLQLRDEGTTLFMSSHILSDVEEICDRVAIMAKGRLREVFSLAEMADRFGQVSVLEILTDTVPEDVRIGATKIIQENLARGVQFALTYPEYQAASAAVARCIEYKVPVVRFTTSAQSLEEVFVRITNESLAEKPNGALPQTMEERV